MMPKEWKIEIFDDPAGGVIFRPDVRFAQNGQSLKGKKGDSVSWSNRTEHELILEVICPKGLANFNRTIARRDQTSLFPIKVSRIKYRCEGFPQEHVIETEDPLVG